MSTTDFTPERSAAIRQLLIDTVADEPRRRKRLQILLTSVLSGVAIVLAGGTAALALSGVIHLGGGETPPAPVPTPTQTVTPTPTPTPTATPTERPIAVQATPIAPRDVTSIPAKPSWSVDLPASGDICEQRSAINVADGLGLVQMGAVEVGDANGCDPVHQKVTLSLLDTDTGSILWSREWAWTVSDPQAIGGTHVSTLVLGSSGRVLVYDTGLTGGPHEVLSLADGGELGSFEPSAQRFQTIAAVPGDSGDVITTLPGEPTTIARVDPLDFEHPRWTTAVNSAGAVYSRGAGPITVSYTDPATNAITWAIVSVDSGTLLPVDAAPSLSTSSVTLQLTPLPDGGSTIAAFGSLDGSALWSRSKTEDTSISVVSEASSIPGQSVDVHQTADLFFTASPRAFTLIDAATGEDVWSVDARACAASLHDGYITPMIDADHKSIHLADATDLCSLDARTGAALSNVTLPGGRTTWPLFGSDLLYEVGYSEDPGTASAYSIAKGDRVWQTASSAHESWFFLGGVLVRQAGNHIESIG